MGDCGPRAVVSSSSHFPPAPGGTEEGILSATQPLNYNIQRPWADVRCPMSVRVGGRFHTGDCGQMSESRGQRVVSGESWVVNCRESLCVADGEGVNGWSKPVDVFRGPMSDVRCFAPLCPVVCEATPAGRSDVR